MRREPNEVKSQGGSGSARLGSRATAAKRSRLRRLTLESLEERALMATAPISVVTNNAPITSNNNNNVNDSNPFVAVDPLDPNKLVTVYTDRNANNGTFIFTQAAYSNDGGLNWNRINLPGLLADPTTKNPTVRYSESDGEGVAFDRNGSVYIGTLEHNGSSNSGAVVLEKYDFTGSALTGGTETVVYQWNQAFAPAVPAVPPVDYAHQPAVMNFSLGVDNNLATFTDPSSGQLQGDPTAGSVYIAWTANTPAPASPPNPYNPYTIEMVASSDGTNFPVGAPGQSPGTLVSGGHFGNQRYTAPQLAISQGLPGVGQADVQTLSMSNGQLNTPTSGAVNVTFTNPTTQAQSTVSIPFNATAATVQSLIDPIFGAGNVVVSGGQLPGNSLTFIGSGRDSNVLIPVAVIGSSTLASGNTGAGSTPTATVTHDVLGGPVGGKVTVIYDDFGSGATANPPRDYIFANSVTFNGTSLNVGFSSFVTSTTVRGALAAPYPLASPVSPIGIGPGAQIAVDNTLGSFSANQGAIYVTYVDRSTATGNPADNTNIFLSKSTDGGQSWTSMGQVNDDLGVTDGFSGASATTGRPQFEPSIAVDPSTGTVALSWLDARNDATGTRYATYLTTSIDGGQSFAVNTFANVPNAVTDAITGKKVIMGPESDNGSVEGSISFGSHQGLAISNGVIHPVWSGTTTFHVNGSSASLGDGFNKQLLGIETSQATYVFGPRVIASTMGPVASQTVDGVTFNNTFAADHTQQVNGFTVTFDRPVSIASFTAADVTVIYRNSSTPLSQPGTTIALDPTTPIQALDSAFDGSEATTFFIKFASPQAGVGTYSYSVGPNITDKMWSPPQILVTPTGPTQTETAVAPQVPQGYPDFTFPSPTITSTINVTDMPLGSVVAGLTVTLDITHHYDSDLTLSLRSPSGKTIVLSDRHGSDLNNYTNTTFDSNSTNPISSANPPYTGTFAPDSSLAALYGDPTNGTWTLSVNDFYGIDFSTLNSWSMRITPGATQLGVVLGHSMDQNANGKQDKTGTSDVFSVPTPLGSTPFQAPYDTTTLPIIVPGPHVVSTFVPFASPSADNLVLNNTVGSMDVVFDRNINPATFTGAQILRMMGPAGLITGTFVVTPEISSPGTQPSFLQPGEDATHIRTFRINFPAFQQLSGTYTLTLGTGIMSTNGDLVDNNLNAGVNLLYATPTGATTDVNYSSDRTKAYPAPDQPLTSANATISAATTVTSTITVNDSYVITNAQLGLNITYPKDSDLTATLKFTPTNTSIAPIVIPLFTNVGGLGSNFTGTTFSDALSNVPIRNGVAPFGGSYNPQSPFSVLNGLTAQGTFTLTITAAAGSTGVGMLNSWGLTLAKSSNVTIPAGTLSPTSPPGVPPAIVPSVTMSTIMVNDPSLIQNVQVGLSLTYPHDADLAATLTFTPTDTTIAPIVVKLFTNLGNVGPTGSQQNFINTSFSNSLLNTPIQNAAPPFTGLFTPETSLSALNGLAEKGTFTLTITNGGTSTGVLTSFTLILTKNSDAGISTGLGEPVADQTSASFRIFTMDPTNPLSSNTWTAVGGASLNGGGASGRIGGIAVDPSDPSGNTVYIAGASGGVWKTSNYLTNSPNGPTYIPLTNAAATNGVNIGSIAVFGRNNDPKQSIVVVGTGEGDTSSPGVGFLISKDGGATWTLLDSLKNYDASGNQISSAGRDHAFLGQSIFKVIIDPRATPTGDIIIYAAVTGSKGGIYRSLDSGKTWQLMRAGQPSDVAFDPNSNVIDAFSNPTGNIRTIYGAFQGDGVYLSPNQGQVWNLMAGGVGDPLIQNINPDTGVSIPIPVTAPAGTPNGGGGRLEIVHPALTGDAVKDLLYENWLYVAKMNSGGKLDGIYMTKDNGQNWVKIRIANAANAGTTGVTKAISPTNDITRPDYDFFGGQGNYDVAIAIDPNNPEVFYLGGSADFGPTPLIRVDVSRLADAHSLFSDPTRNGGGLLLNTTDPISPFSTDPNKLFLSPFIPDPLTNPFTNLIRDPNSPFLADGTVLTVDAGTLANSGSGARWTPFGSSLGGTDYHHMVVIKDPISGKTRLIIGDDQGTFTTVDDGTGNVLSSIGTQTLPTGSRNGNIQITQFYNGAAQPSSLAAQIAGALFYGVAQDDGFPQSDPNVLTNGNIGWNGGGGDGTAVSTDATGTGTSYSYRWPCCGGNGADFFQVALPGGGGSIGRTNGLIQTTSAPPGPFQGTGDPQWPSLGGYNFFVNPVNPKAIVIGSGAGRLFGTEDQGLNWAVLADPATFDGSPIPALAYGAPDPNGPGTPGALDNYILAGTEGGHIYVSFTGGGSIGGGNAWTNISTGITGGSVIRIVTDPTRGTHDAYATTSGGVFFNADTSAAGSNWVNITGNLFNQKFNPFGDPNLVDTQLKSLGDPGVNGGLAADWRYVIPNNPANPNGPTHPLLYVSGNGGVFRSTDMGVTWTVFPAMYQSPATAPLNLNTPAGGYLPTEQISSLSLAIGNVDPTTGHSLTVSPNGATSPNVLVASTYGQGSFAIRLAPVVFNDAFNKVALSTTLPAPLGSDTGKFNNDNITNQTQPVFTGLSEQTAFGNQVAVTLMDVTDPLHPFFLGGYDPSKPTTDPSFTKPANETDAFGHFNVQVNAGSYDAVNHTTDGLRTVAVFATDAAGTRGNSVNYSFTLITRPPATPAAPVLQTASDTGFSATDGYTSQNKPTFNVLPTVDNSIILLFRKLTTAPAYPTTPVNTVSVPIGLPTVLTAIQDPGPVPDGTYTYMTEIEDLAGNISQPSPDSQVITIDTVAPVAPSAPVLQASSDTGASQTDGITSVKNPTFTVTTGEAAPTRTLLLRGAQANGAGATVVSFISGVGSIQDPGPVPDGTYYYFTEQTDLAGNAGPLSATGTMVQILSVIPGPAPTLFLLPNDDSGLKGDNKTNVKQPHLYGIAPVPVAPGYSLDLVQVSSSGNTVLTTIPDPNNGSFIIQFPAPLADGTYTDFVQVRDVAGNTLASRPLTLTIKTTPPLTPPTLSILPADDSGIPGDGKTYVRRPHLVGMTDSGAVVNILDSSGNVLATTTASTFAVNGHPIGYYSAQLASNLSDGTIPLYAVATDIEGNSTPVPASPSLNLTIYTVQGDYNGTGNADLATFRYDPAVVSTSTWFLANSGSAPTQVLLGSPGHDLPVPGDYNGAGRTLPAVFRPETDTWYIGTPGSQTVIQQGTVGQDIPVPAAYDTSGRTDVATYNPSTQTWNVLLNLSNPTNPNNRLTAQFGFASTDQPVAGDYLGLGYAQLAVYRPQGGQWYVRDANQNPLLEISGVGGQPGDVPVPADYDGIGKAEPAVYRPSTGQFIIYNSNTMQVEVESMTFPTGYASQPGDLPVPEDYNGDGKVDMAVFRPSTDSYFIDYSTNVAVAFTLPPYYPPGTPPPAFVPPPVVAPNVNAQVVPAPGADVGHDVAPQAPLSLIAGTIRGANGPGIPQAASAAVATPAFLAATTTVSAAFTTAPPPAVKAALVVAASPPSGSATGKTNVLPTVAATPIPVLTVATPFGRSKGNARHHTPVRPNVVVSHKTPIVHHQTHPTIAVAHAKTPHDLAIAAIGKLHKGRFFG